MLNKQPTSPPIELSGMVYHGGKYDADYWLKLTGHDPRNYPEYFHIYPQSGYVTTTKDYRDFCDAYFARARANWYALGVNA
jgi:hypothetical protein